MSRADFSRSRLLALSALASLASAALLLLLGCRSRREPVSALGTAGGADGTALRSAAANAPTWTRDIGPLVARSCGACHAPIDGRPAAAPPALGSYEDVRRSAGAALLAIRRRMMPPFGPDDTGLCGTWLDAAWLTDAEIAAFAAWVERGAPRGDAGAPEATPTAPSDVATPRLDGRTDQLVDVEPEAAYTPGLGARAYRCFVVQPARARAQPTFVTGWTVSSEPASAVRQAALYAVDRARGARGSHQVRVHTGDADGDPPGWACYGAPSVPGAKLLASWSRDTPVVRLPPGTGVPIGRRTTFVLQLRYDLIASAPEAPVRARMTLATDDAVARAARLVAVRPAPFVLPPGQAQVRVRASWTADRATMLWGLVPRMHTLGRVLDLARTSADGAPLECLAHFGHWNLYDQQLFRRVAPVNVAPGDRITLTCAFATTSRDAETKMGEAPDDEQCLAHLYLVDPP